MMIEINNLTVGRGVDENFLKKIVKKVLIGENKENKDVSIVLLGPGRMKNLNKKYRKKNKTTDVLSFQYDDSGEIILCLSQIKKNARKLNISFEKELNRVLIHGILHLLGYDHEDSRRKAEEMQKKEDYYLSSL